MDVDLNNISDLIAFSVVYTPLSYNEIMDMQISDINNVIYITNFKTESEKIEKYNLLRWQTTCLLNVHLKHNIKPNDLIQFDWDSEDDSEVIEGNITEINFNELANINKILN